MNQWANLQTSAVYKVYLFTFSFFYAAVRKLLLLSQWYKTYDHVRSWKSSKWVKYEKN